MLSSSPFPPFHIRRFRNRNWANKPKVCLFKWFRNRNWANKPKVCLFKWDLAQ